MPGSESKARANDFANRCALEQWRLAHGEASSVRRTLEFLGRSDAKLDAGGTPASNFACATLLAAWHSVLSGSPDSPRKVAVLDSLFRTGIPSWLLGFQHGNLLLARLYEAQGDLPRAAETIKRRTFGLGVPAYLATYLREEGRLAALTGDRAGAIRAYQHYLFLRADPEPSVRPQVAEVRKELAKLLAVR